MKREFEFIADVIASGVNMFGMRPYIMEEFGLDKKQAGEVLNAYIRQELDRDDEMG